MTITIRRPSSPTREWAIDGAGTIAVFVPATVDVSDRTGTYSAYEAIAMRWTGAPSNARMSQRLSLRAFLLTDAAMAVPLHPSPPHTDVVIRMRGCDPRTRVVVARFPLSPPPPAHRVWRVDALPDLDRRDPGRAYLTDESYTISDRQGSTITYYDRPSLGLEDLRAALRAQRLSPATHTSCELIAMFHTELWRGERRLGIVQWTHIQRYFTAQDTGSTTPTGYYEPTAFHTGLPPLTPTPTESRRMLQAWQRTERRRDLCGD